MLTLKTGPVQARGPWKLDELCEDFHDSFGLLVRGLGLEPRSLLRRRIYCPIFLLLAVFDQDTIFCPVRCVYQFRQPTHIFRTLKSFADLRHTLCLTFTYIQPMGRHGLSFEERPLTSGPSLSTKSHAGLVYLQLSPAIQKFDFNQLSSKHMLFAIGLLAPQPRLIARLL